MFAAAQSGPNDASLDVANLFASSVWSGNSATQSITSNIDLGPFSKGFTWIKCRNATVATPGHALFDTLRGATNRLATDSANASSVAANTLTAFGPTGFTLGNDALVNATGNNYVGWTFKAAPRFLDVVTYTGTGGARTIPHSVGIDPGMIWVKRTDNASDWYVHHYWLAGNRYLVLNSTAAEVFDTTVWNNTSPTASQFSVGGVLNTLNAPYVAYVFGRGVSLLPDLLSAFIASANGSGVLTLNMNFFPQWMLLKSYSAPGDWIIADIVRGLTFAASNSATLLANTNAVEATGVNFRLYSDQFGTNRGITVSGLTPGANYITFAVAQGPTSLASAGTDVFMPSVRIGTSAATTLNALGKQVDLVITKQRSGTQTWAWTDRVRGATRELTSASNAAETVYANDVTSFVSNTGVSMGTGAAGNVNTSAATYVDYLFRKAPGFMDFFGYPSGTSTSAYHGLQIKSSLYMYKSTSAVGNWFVGFVFDLNNQQQVMTLSLNSTAAGVLQNPPLVYPQGDDITNYRLNVSGLPAGTDYFMLVAGIVPGVTSIGRYTGTGSSVVVPCGFSTGTRFILIKRLDAAGDWYIWDSVRGISSLNDPYLVANSTAAEVTTNDSVDSYSGGFYVYQNATTNLNVLNGTYAYWAIA